MFHKLLFWIMNLLLLSYSLIPGYIFPGLNDWNKDGKSIGTEVLKDHKLGLTNITVFGNIRDFAWDQLLQLICDENNSNKASNTNNNRINVVHLTCKLESQLELEANDNLDVYFENTKCDFKQQRVRMLCPDLIEKFKKGGAIPQDNHVWKLLVQKNKEHGTHEFDDVASNAVISQVILYDSGGGNKDWNMKSIIDNILFFLPLHLTPYAIDVHKSTELSIIADATFIKQQIKFDAESNLHQVLSSKISIDLMERSQWAKRHQKLRAHSSEQHNNCPDLTIIPTKVRKLISAFSQMKHTPSSSSSSSYKATAILDDTGDIFPGTNTELTTPHTRVLCMTYTYSPRHINAQAIAATWGGQCDGYLAFSNEETVLYDDNDHMSHGDNTSNDNSFFVTPETLHFDTNLATKQYREMGRDVDTQVLPWYLESYNDMWMKALVIWFTVATSSLAKEYDYFLLGGDDLYVHVPRLHALLNSQRIRELHDKGTPLYMGRPGKQNSFLSFHMGGAGYILNDIALKRLVQVDLEKCFIHTRSSMEDLFVSNCLRHAGVDMTSPDETWFADPEVKREANDHLQNGVSNNNNPENSIRKEDNLDNNSKIEFKGKSIFHPFSLMDAYNGSDENILIRMVDHASLDGSSDGSSDGNRRHSNGSDCCSPYSISFQDVFNDKHMYCLHQLIHTSRRDDENEIKG